MGQIHLRLPGHDVVFLQKHHDVGHLTDGHLQLACCSERNANEHIEIGAEIFAAELIFPEEDFVTALDSKGIALGHCTPDAIVRLKRETQTTLSYAGLAKRATFLGFAPSGSLDGVRWKKLEEEIYGEPLYKVILRRRGCSR